MLTKIIFASDLHGEIDLYNQLYQLARDSSAGIVALGGDLLPSLGQSKSYEDMFLEQKFFIGRSLRPFFKKCLESTTVKKIFLIAGNWDLAYPEIFDEPLEGVIDLNQKSYGLLNGYAFIGYPFVPPTPFRPKDYEKMDNLEAPWPPQKTPSYIRSSDPDRPLISIDPHSYLKQGGSIAEDLNRLPGPKEYGKAVYLMHPPPYGTKLDQIQGGQFVGSRSIKAFIKRAQPLLTLHGHIHESPEVSGHFYERIGKTLSVNPGQPVERERGCKKLHAISLELENPASTLRHTCL